MSSALFETFTNLAWPPRVSIVQGGRGARAPRNAEVSFLGPCRRRESLPKPRHDSFCEQDVELLSLDNISRAVFAEFKPKSFVIAERAPLHNGGSPSKSLAQFFSRNIVPLPTEQLRLPRQPRPLVVPAVKARRGGRDAAKRQGHFVPEHSRPIWRTPSAFSVHRTTFASSSSPGG